MAQQGRWFGVGILGVSACLLGGCTQLPDWAQPRHSLAQVISEPGIPQPRAQMSDGPKIGPIAPLKPIDIAAPMPIETTSQKAEIQQASYTNRGTVRVRVRAWVNGRPIFDNEVMQMAGPELSRLPNGLTNAERTVKMAEVVNSAIEQLIDSELMFQDAVKKLEKNNPSALDKLKEFVDLEFDKTMEKMRKAGVPEKDIRELEPAARRMMERNLISSEYARSRIKPIIETRIGLVEIREYYETHLSEFVSEDKVVWQDIFLPVSPNNPTLDQLTRFAQDLINRCRTPDDFNKLLIYDALGKNGEGLGQRKGEIRPAELEPHLFALAQGQIGPVVPVGTGVHLIRVVKRDYKGQLPLNDEVAKTIRRKLEKDLADREYRRIVRELRARSVWRIESDTQ